MLAEGVLDYMVVSCLVILNGSVLVQAGGLVVFGVSLWSCLVSQLDLCLCVLKTFIQLLIY